MGAVPGTEAATVVATELAEVMEAVAAGSGAEEVVVLDVVVAAEVDAVTATVAVLAAAEACPVTTSTLLAGTSTSFCKVSRECGDAAITALGWTTGTDGAAAASMMPEALTS